jgi:hypothetical protein
VFDKFSVKLTEYASPEQSQRDPEYLDVLVGFLAMAGKSRLGSKLTTVDPVIGKDIPCMTS